VRSSFLVLVAVFAMFLSACEGEGGAQGAANETQPVEAAPKVVLPPSDFGAKPTSFSISLSWVAPTGEPEVDQYVLYRNGSAIESVDGSTTTHVDDHLTPGEDYSYEIEARAGELISERVGVEARTPIPPLRAARVVGVFNVRTKQLSASGYRTHPVQNFGWRLRPRCSEGSCDIRWNDLQSRRIRSVLERRGARYKGTYRGVFNTTCAGARSVSVVRIRFRVAAARMIDGEWRATRLKGMLYQTEASQLGCVSSYARTSLRARLIRWA
jgi:hypothetical protein